jgi:hypothetical protein
MLIDAALKAERFHLARALLSERTALRPRNGWGWKHTALAAEGLGERAAAQAAREAAKRLLAA